MRTAVFTTIIIFISISIIAQTNNSNPCSAPEARQFDFWIGEWTAEWSNQNGEKVYGTNSIKSIWDGCVIEENFNGSPGSPLTGKSFSVFNPETGKWYQTWIDNQGGYIPFTGEFEDDKMTMVTERTEKDGKKVLMRMVWHNITENEFDWNWERSEDNGNTWKPRWVIHYTRK